MKKILKYTGLSISIIMLTVSVVFIDLLINVRVVPVKYCIIAAVVLVILTAVQHLHKSGLFQELLRR